MILLTMKKLRFCHLVWSAPMEGDRWGIKNQLYHNIWMFALSVALVKKAGHTVVLHTDSVDKDLFGFLPYDEVFTTLDSFQCATRFWAAGKLQTWLGFLIEKGLQLYPTTFN